MLLDPHARTPLSRADLSRAREGGLLGVDCSWNRLGQRGRLPGEAGPAHGALRRRLPYLLATNPQHFGRLSELNTAEAFGAALCVLGESERANALLAEFAGGTVFAEVNGRLLARYVLCRDPEGVLEAERELFGAPNQSTG